MTRAYNIEIFCSGEMWIIILCYFMYITDKLCKKVTLNPKLTC